MLVIIRMQRLIYLLSYPFLWFISLLPFPMVYAFSDFAYLLVYRIFGYRKKVVRANLSLVFPDVKEQELLRIESRFYHHLCDMFLESIKTMNISEASLRKRYHLENLSLLQEMEKKGSVLVLFSHYGNWEWSILVNRFLSSKGYAVYQKLNNIYFDRLIKRIRGRWNTTLIPQKEAVRTVMHNEKSGQSGVYGLVSDQSPQAHRAQYWAPFMGVTVPIFNGPESLARKLGLSVVYARVSKKSRGHYALEFVPICKDGRQTRNHEITDQFLRLTEAQIRNDPAFYLWTHRRWKHRDKVPKSAKEASPLS